VLPTCPFVCCRYLPCVQLVTRKAQGAVRLVWSVSWVTVWAVSWVSGSAAAVSWVTLWAVMMVQALFLQRVCVVVERMQCTLPGLLCVIVQLNVLVQYRVVCGG
jgi:hypothetical protein